MGKLINCSYVRMLLTTNGLGVSLWLCPKRNSPLYDKLSTLMASLQTLFPGQPASFEPHITITSNIKIDLDDSVKRKDDVDKILSASVVAINSLPKNHSDLVSLGKLNSQRKFFKKLYFEVRRDPSLVSFARIIRELFVVLPNAIEEEDKALNPKLYTTDSKGNKVKVKKHKHGESEVEHKKVDIEKLQRESALKAAEWSTGEFDPHLSLIYSEMYPIDSALWRTINTRVQDYLNVDKDDASDLSNTGLGWDGGVLKLVLCEGDVNDWIVLGSVDLH